MVIRINSQFSRQWKFLVVLALLFLAGASRANAQSCTGVASTATGSVRWSPQWCQEFNGNQAPPDTSAWTFDLGNNNGWGNNEVEVYCGPPTTANNPSPCPNMFNVSTNTSYIDGSGHLVIQPIFNNGTWISARLNTLGKQNFQYGRIEASIQLPDTTNPGLWPAYWSLGSNIATTAWPTCGEADFMENWSPAVLSGPGPAGNRTTIHTALTGGTGSGGIYPFPSGQAANTAFHTYGVIWSANMMQFYVDDATRPFLIKTPADLPSGDTWPFNAPNFLLLNVAIGGTLGGSTANLVNPQPMLVDYVRQYSTTALAKPLVGSPSSISVKAGATTGNSSTFTPGLTPATGYVYFSCSTDAPKTTCSIATNDPLNTHVANSSATESVTVTVATTANALVPPLLLKPQRTLRITVFILVVLVPLAVVALTRRMRGRTPHLFSALAATAILAGVMLYGCGGGNSTTTPPANNGTPPGSYTVTVFAFTESNTSDGTNANADASVTIPLTVN